MSGLPTPTTGLEILRCLLFLKKERRTTVEKTIVASISVNELSISARASGGHLMGVSFELSLSALEPCPCFFSFSVICVKVATLVAWSLFYYLVSCKGACQSSHTTYLPLSTTPRRSPARMLVAGSRFGSKPGHQTLAITYQNMGIWAQNLGN